MPHKKPVLMLVKYMPKPGSEERLLETAVVEMFEWTDDTSSETAHQLPEVMAVWEPMGPLLENMELTRLERV